MNNRQIRKIMKRQLDCAYRSSTVRECYKQYWRRRYRFQVRYYNLIYGGDE
jgi:hypothetical protein